MKITFVPRRSIFEQTAMIDNITGIVSIPCNQIKSSSILPKKNSLHYSPYYPHPYYQLCHQQFPNFEVSENQAIYCVVPAYFQISSDLLPVSHFLVERR